MAPRPSSKKPQDISSHNRKMAKRIKRASQLPHRFRACVYGRPGSGKTRFAASAPKVLIIDVNDEGTDSVRNDWDPQVFEVKYWQEINDIYWFLESGDHQFESVVLDGVTGLQNLCMKFVLGDEASRDASRDPDMPSRQVWGKVGELMKTQIINYRNLPMHVIFTALERRKSQGDDDDDTMEVYTSPQVSPGIANTLEGAVGMIGYLGVQQVVQRQKEGDTKKRTRVARTRLWVGPREGYLTKDRYGLKVPYLEAPNVQKIIDSIYGGKT